MLQYLNMNKVGIKLEKHLLCATTRGPPALTAVRSTRPCHSAKAVWRKYQSEVRTVLQLCIQRQQQQQQQLITRYLHLLARQGHQINSYSDVAWSRQKSQHTATLNTHTNKTVQADGFAVTILATYRFKPSGKDTYHLLQHYSRASHHSHNGHRLTRMKYGS
jgi:hypothetical protein